MHLSLVFAFFSLASASHSPLHHRAPRMSSLSLSTPSLSLPSPSLPSLSLPLSSSSPSPSPSPLPSTSLDSPTPPPDPSTTPTPSPTSSPSPLTSSTPSSPGPTSALTSTSSTSTPPAAAIAQQSYSSSTPTTFATTAGVSAPGLSSSVVVVTSASVTPSPTATQSASSGFFSNTGAVAGTFTVIGLVGVAGVIAVALLIVKRRHSRSYEEDMEYLDHTPDPPADPPMTQVTSLDDGFTSDHGHYNAPPMVLATPPAAYYPDHAYALHPQAFLADPPGSHVYPVGYTQDYAAQHIYSPDDYDIAYPPVDPNMPNPHEFADVQLDSAPVPPTQTVLPDALRPSVKPTPTVPKQWANTRFSVDSFYAGIVTDNHPSPGQAL